MATKEGVRHRQAEANSGLHLLRNTSGGREERKRGGGRGGERGRVRCLDKRGWRERKERKSKTSKQAIITKQEKREPIKSTYVNVTKEQRKVETETQKESSKEEPRVNQWLLVTSV